jgi:hypothetical protein
LVFPSHDRIRLALSLLALAVVQLVVALGAMFVSQPLWILEAVLCSFVVVSGTYMAVHWTFRPENLFNPRLLAAATPFTSTLLAIRRRRSRARRRAQRGLRR